MHDEIVHTLTQRNALELRLNELETRLRGQASVWSNLAHKLTSDAPITEEGWNAAPNKNSVQMLYEDYRRTKQEYVTDLMR